MNDDVLMSPHEVKRISSGYEQPRRELEALREQGFWRARLGRDHQVVLLIERAHFDAVCAGAVEPGPKHAILTARSSTPSDERRRGEFERKRVTISNGRYYYIQDLEERRPSGKPKQKWHSLTRVEAGEIAMLNALDELLGSAKANATAGNFRTAIAAFKKVKLPELTYEVKKEYGRMLDIATVAFRDFDVVDVTPGDVLSFLNDNFAQHPTARRSYKARLSTFFSWCALERLCATTPCREIKLKAPPKRRLRMNDAVYWAIHDRLPPIGQCFLELCFLTTARPTEIRLLEESQIDAGVIHFTPTKTEHSSGATVDWPITPEIERVLKRARALNKLKAGPRGNAYVIQERSGSCYTRTGLWSVWKKARTAADVANVTTRDVRAFALTTAENMGYKLEDLRKAAAHTTTSATEGYLDQYRHVVSPVKLTLPSKPLKR